MSAEVDHVFICTAVGAPAAARLLEFGLLEGSPNQHPGQGTACRRFFFQNAMLELLWVENAAEARSDPTRRTRLWERWSNDGSTASPFGVVLRPAPGTKASCPFPAWEYRPATMQDLVLHIAEGTGLEEPMWCYHDSGRIPAEAPLDQRQPLGHPAGLRDITGVRVVCPEIKPNSVTLAMMRSGAIVAEIGPGHLLELNFDSSRSGKHVDFRPDLPLALSW